MTPEISTQYDQASEAVEYIRSRTPMVPEVAIILGSGLGNFADQVNTYAYIPYTQIPHFPPSTVVGHSGNMVLGTIGGVPVVVLQGRAHAYEGHPMASVTFATRVAGLLGAKILIVTNAAGGINREFRKGSLIVISDHINLTGMNAAMGPNDPRFGERFFDMSHAYSARLRELAVTQAKELGYELKSGVYLAVLGPSFETPAEIRAFRTLGADLVGMSTVHEVIVARHMGIEVLGISLVTNMASGVLEEAIDHNEVLDIGRRVEQEFTALLTAIVPKIQIPPTLP
jgi:purine-nucleoside phosphorylase